MNRILRVARAVLLFLLPASPLIAQDDRAYAGHWACFAITPDQSTYYTTGAWDGTYYTQEVMNGFAQEIWNKYGVAARASCSRANLEGATLAQIHTGWLAQATAWRGAGKKVVQVSWTYNPATAKHPHLCTAIAQVMREGKRVYTYYHNKIIRIPGATQAKLTMAWDAHVKQLSPGAYFPAGAGCTLLPADSAAQNRQVEGTIKMYDSQKPEVKQLDWVFESASPEEEAAAKAADDAPAFYCQMTGEASKEWYASPVQVADKAWKWEDYTGAWRLYVKNTLKLNADLFRGACEPGTMKVMLRHRDVRKEEYKGRGWTKLHDVDWKYVP